ncbi:uncharacterized protein Z519_06538 [Cladophialophora bantiana CBS 173.52]|uniref:Metallo-beta-lactamase domain-containing protein n=1 Tax=Cladophialophora bantiana (strain ATCC 10958 / CBS 173.52 / CDC B-1940 / NIH 8579) TaxID=1442370 RepID=A0A0D2ERZ5_CLAB1|nr:uncharacterized protein Z519_06538 [Cladophialophora bantiana CBS 173.52]KIW92691.1 hypothetical protein Z519_06538 [Cladophialophora bantiana CBS 173.52]
MKSSLLSSILFSILPPLALSEFVTSKNGLQVDVYHLPPAPVVYENSTNLSFSPTAFTFIHGTHEAVLVDSPATFLQGQNLTKWVKDIVGPHKSLKYIYVTHGHGDHFFTALQIAANWPGCQVVAKADVNAHMLQQYEEPLFTDLWLSLFPGGQITSQPFNATLILPANGTFEIEGHIFRAVEVGQGDTSNSTVLHVPDVDLVVGGDVVYGNCHQLFVEDLSPRLRNQWIVSLDKVAALRPRFVVPSHTKPGDGFAPSHIADTKLYIRAWEKALATSGTWQELEDAMKTQFPLRAGSFILRWSSQAPFNAASV